MVILVKNIVIDLISLLFEEVSGSYHLVKETVYPDKLVLSLPFGAKFLFVRLNIGSWCYHGHKTTDMASHVLVHLKLCINVPLYVPELVY